MPQSRYFTGSLYTRMAEDLHLGGMAERTHAGYLRAVRKLADFSQTSPDKITEDQLRRYFLHMKNDLEYAYGTLRVAFSGIKFFYTRTCKRDWQTLRQMKLQNVKSLPEVITRKQVLQIIQAAKTQRMAVYFWTVYSLGLRMQEGLNLQVGDIDAERSRMMTASTPARSAGSGRGVDQTGRSKARAMRAIMAARIARSARSRRRRRRACAATT